MNGSPRFSRGCEPHHATGWLAQHGHRVAHNRLWDRVGGKDDDAAIRRRRGCGSRPGGADGRTNSFAACTRPDERMPTKWHCSYHFLLGRRSATTMVEHPERTRTPVWGGSPGPWSCGTHRHWPTRLRRAQHQPGRGVRLAYVRDAGCFSLMMGGKVTTRDAAAEIGADMVRGEAEIGAGPQRSASGSLGSGPGQL